MTLPYIALPPSRRRFPNSPEIAREYWRYALITDAFARQRIKHVIAQDLRPLWNDRGSELGGSISEEAGWREIIALAESQRESGTPPSVKRYEDALVRTVSETLRFRHDGAPAPWALDYLRRDVVGQFPPSPLPPDPEEPLPAGMTIPARLIAPDGELLTLSGSVSVALTPYGASVQTERGEWELPDPAGRWYDWDSVARLAHDALDVEFQRVRREYDALIPRQANTAADERRNEDARVLVAYLLDRVPFTPDRAARRRLERLAQLVGLDFPIPPNP